MIANFHLSPILHCLPPLSYFQRHKIQIITTLLGRFQLRSDISHSWKDFILVSDMQKRVHNLALKIEFSSLTNTTLLTTSIVFQTPQNIQILTPFLGRFQRRSDLLQAWNIFILVSEMKNALFIILTLIILLWIISFVHRVHASHYHTAFTMNLPDNNNLTGAMPAQICALPELVYLFYDTAEVTGCA